MDCFSLVVSLINGLSSTVSIISNSLVLVAIFKTPSLHTPNNVFLFSLSATDFATGFIVQPLFIIDISPLPKSFSRPYLSFCYKFFFAVSLLTLLMIALDRFLALYWHMRYPVKVTFDRARAVVVVNWLSLIPLIKAYDLGGGKRYKLGIIIPFFLCISIAILFCHFKIYKITQRHRRQIVSQRQAIFLSTVQQAKSIRTAWYIHILFVICVLPSIFSKIADTIVADGNPLLKDIKNASKTIIFLSSMLNPFLFSYRSRKIYKVAMSMIKPFAFSKNRRTDVTHMDQTCT